MDFSHEENHNDWDGDQIIILQQDIQYKREVYEIRCPQGIQTLENSILQGFFIPSTHLEGTGMSDSFA